jgi:hypothetical protein
VVSGWGGSGGLKHAVGDPVEGFGVAGVGLAGGTGLVGAFGAHPGAVALVVGGDVRRDEDRADIGVGEDDGVLICCGNEQSGFGLRANAMGFRA